MWAPHVAVFRRLSCQSDSAAVLCSVRLHPVGYVHFFYTVHSVSIYCIPTLPASSPSQLTLFFSGSWVLLQHHYVELEARMFRCVCKGIFSCVCMCVCVWYIVYRSCLTPAAQSDHSVLTPSMYAHVFSQIWTDELFTLATNILSQNASRNTFLLKA